MLFSVTFAYVAVGSAGKRILKEEGGLLLSVFFYRVAGGIRQTIYVLYAGMLVLARLSETLGLVVRVFDG